MQKTAQKRSILNKLKEMTNVGGIASEKFFNPEFKEVMDQLREKTDDPVRAIVSGVQIGESPAPADGISLKDLLKSAKSNINRREYMKSVAELGKFHKKMFDLVKILSSFRGNVDKVHERFLFGDLDEDSKKHLQELKGRFAKQTTNYFIKEANILDFFANIGTERGRALAAWEKRYPKQIGKLKKDTLTILLSSERLLSTVLTVLKELASARAARNPDNYIKASDKIIKTYENYDKVFKEFYNSNIKNFLEKQELIAPAKIDITQMPEELGKQEIAAPPATSVTAPSVPAPGISSGVTPLVGPPSGMESSPQMNPEIPPPPAMPTNVGPSVPVTPMPAHPESEIPDLLPKMRIESPKLRVANTHKKFFESLEAMADEDPILLANHIAKYAKYIQAYDTDTSIKLFKIAKSIKG